MGEPHARFKMPHVKMDIVKICASLHISAVICAVIPPDEIVFTPPGNVFNVSQGASFKLACNFTARHCMHISYKWTKPATNDADRVSVEDNNLSFDNVTFENEGPYQCEVTCDGTSKSKKVKMNVYNFGDPVLNMSSILREDQTVNVTCRSKRSHRVSNVDIIWRLGDKLLKNDTKEVNDNLDTISSLTWTPVRMDHGKNLTCIIELTEYDVTKVASQTLEVMYAPKVVTTVPPPLYEGQEVHMNCTADGYPIPFIEWRRVNQLWPRNLHAYPNGTVSGVLHHADGGRYECIGVNDIAKKRSQVSLDVHYGPTNTSIMASPNQVIHQGGLLNLTCVTDIHPKAKQYTWRKIPAVTLPGEATVEDSTLTIENFQKTHEGIYECEVTHINGRLDRAYFNATLQEPKENMSGQVIAVATGSVLCGVIGGTVAGFLMAKWLAK